MVEYDWAKAEERVLAYAVSVHKSQGTEFPVVVLPVIIQHYIMLQRNLLYTAITRTRRLFVLAGNKRAIETTGYPGAIPLSATGLQPADLSIRYYCGFGASFWRGASSGN